MPRFLYRDQWPLRICVLEETVQSLEISARRTQLWSHVMLQATKMWIKIPPILLKFFRHRNRTTYSLHHNQNEADCF